MAGGAGTLPVAPGWGVRSGAPPEYVWSTIVPAGGTVEFMHFSVLGDPADPAGLQAQAQALVDLTDPDALFGLSAEEKWRILIGADAECMDRLARKDPEQAYEQSFVDALRAEGHWRAF